MDGFVGLLVGLFFLALFLGLYFLPTIVGAMRKVPSLGSVIVVNLFLGWTFLGWVVAMAMAARSAQRPQVVIQQTAPGNYPPPQ